MTSSRLDIYLDGFHDFTGAFEGVDDAEALAFRSDHWPKHPDWAGEDGSIAGIVWHVAAWKTVWANAIEKQVYGGQAEVRPESETWEGRKAWLQQAHERIVSILTDAEREGRDYVILRDKQRPVNTVNVLTNDHDAYHAAQIWYIRQRYLAEHH